MSLPPGFLDELRNRLSLVQVVGRKVTWDLRKSNQGKGDFWAPCPFHQEKSASFHVDDRKGFYYCFGCQAKGDMLAFVQQTENVGFIEAVQILAREAGLPMPAQDPRAREKQDRRSQLAEVMEQAIQWFRLQLSTGGGAVARDYLARRRLSEAGQQRFEIGWAPDNRHALTGALKAKGVAPELIVAAGLAAEPEDGGAPYDRFRGRVIFPIRDGQGRAIGLGGRSLDPNARAKYLNSPQTELFDKGRELYSQKIAREAVGKGATLIVAEGYMDVIALAEAGFGGAVAPLGTAVTEDQLRLMWRIADEPVIALDGDAAGLRAALRVVELALPLLTAGKGLRFVTLPQGQDPDDLIKAGGPPAMQAVLDRARPMIDLLWQRETEGKVFDSPERRAALDRDLRNAVKRIQDPSIRKHYGDELNYRRQDLFRPQRPAGQGQQGQGFSGQGFPGQTREGRGPGGAGRQGWSRPGQSGFPGRQRPDGSVLAETRASALASPQEGVERRLREALVLAVLIDAPELIVDFETRLDRLEMQDPDHEALWTALHRHATALPAAMPPMGAFPPGPPSAPQPGGFAEDPSGWQGSGAGGLRALLAAEVGGPVLERLYASNHIRIVPALKPGAPADLKRACLQEELEKLFSESGLNRAVDEAAEDIAGLADEGVTWRLKQAAEARARAFRAESEDKAVYERAENGLALNRDEKTSFDEVLSGISFSKGGRGN